MILPIVFVFCLCRSYAYDDVYLEDRNLVECGGTHRSTEYSPCSNQDVDYQKLAGKLVKAQVAIMRMFEDTQSYRYWCSGVFVTRRHILTSASYFFPRGQMIYEARIGSTDLNQSQIYNIQDIKIHERFNGDIFNENNIAILVLTKAVEDPKIGVVCLPDDQLAETNFTNLGLSMAGWGRREDTTSPPDSRPFYISHMIILEKEKCDRFYNTSHPSGFVKGVTKGLMCATFLEGEKIICGTAGSPIMFLHEDRWYGMGLLVSIVCNAREIPVYFAPGTVHANWIRETIRTSV